MRQVIRGVFVFFLAATATESLSAAEFFQMLRRVPGETNILVLVDADRLLASPIADAKGWKAKASKDAALRPILLPPGAHKVVRAITADLNTQTPTSEITLIEMPKGLALKTIAERQKGYVEKISNVDTVWLPKGAYGIKLTDDLFGFLFPANRQFLSRWIRDQSGQVSNFLSDASRELKPKGPQLLVAIDLEDFVSPDSIDERLKNFTSLGTSPNELKAIGKVLAGIRGLKFAVTFDKQAIAKLTLNFDSDVAPLTPIAKPMLLEAMGRHGVTFDEADDWQVTTDGRQLMFGGEVSESGLMRLSSLFELPSDLIDDAELQTDADNPVLYATQAHYKMVQQLTDDLFAKKKQSFGQYAQWAEQYAKKIDRLPLLNVDKDMQEYSANISELLRNGAKSFKGVGIRAAGRQSQVWSGTYVNYDYYGYRSYGFDAGTQEKRAIRGQEKASGAMDAAEMKRLVEEESAAIRKVMVDRYKVEF